MGRLLIAVLCARALCSAQAATTGQADSSSYDALAASQLAQAQTEYEKVKTLVEQGTLPRAKESEAREGVADAEDNLTLAHTLYRPLRLEDMTLEQAAAMTAAAQRRIDRQQKLVDSRRDLVASGILPRAELEAFEQGLADRRHVLALAENRAQLLAQLQSMAEAERRLEDAASHVMIRYDGSGVFRLSQMSNLTEEFRRRFHRALPVSAQGQTLIHQAMGLDHRNRVDVALSPDSVEGVWFRQLLERLRIPYLAFRSAVSGAATAPHIHIGLGSPRLAPSTVGVKSAQAAGRDTKRKRNSADLAVPGESVVRGSLKDAQAAGRDTKRKRNSADLAVPGESVVRGSSIVPDVLPSAKCQGTDAHC